MEKLFDWDGRRSEIVDAVELVMRRELQKNSGSLMISMPLRKLYRKRMCTLPNDFNLFSLQIKNAIRGEWNPGKNLRLSQEKGFDIITFYSEKMHLALKLVQESLKRETNPATILNLAA